MNSSSGREPEKTDEPRCAVVLPDGSRCEAFRSDHFASMMLDPHDFVAPEPPIAVIACTAEDMALDRCEGCGVGFPEVPGKPFASLDAKDAHQPKCLAFRDWLIAVNLVAQARDDGRDDEAEEIEGERSWPRCARARTALSSLNWAAVRDE